MPLSLTTQRTPGLATSPGSSGPARLAMAAALLMLAVLATACATPAASDAAVADAGADQVCTRETQIGSNRVVSRCVSRAQAEAERDAAREAVSGMRSSKGSRPDAPGL